jgi:hypothetical protein
MVAGLGLLLTLSNTSLVQEDSKSKDVFTLVSISPRVKSSLITVIDPSSLIREADIILPL